MTDACGYAVAVNSEGGRVLAACASQQPVRNARTSRPCLRAVWATVISRSANRLAEFLGEVMHLLETAPDAPEILVERVRALRFAQVNGTYEAIFSRMSGLTEPRKETV